MTYYEKKINYKYIKLVKLFTKSKNSYEKTTETINSINQIKLI